MQECQLRRSVSGHSLLASASELTSSSESPFSMAISPLFELAFFALRVRDHGRLAHSAERARPASDTLPCNESHRPQVQASLMLNTRRRAQQNSRCLLASWPRSDAVPEDVEGSIEVSKRQRLRSLYSLPE